MLFQNNNFEYEGSFSTDLFSRFQEFRNSFVKKPLNGTVAELNFSSFDIYIYIDIGTFEMQLLNLNKKELWSSKFESLNTHMEKLMKIKCDLSSQHK